MARTSYEPNHHELGKFLRSRELERVCERRANEVATEVRAGMPHRTGRLAGSVHVEGGHVALDGLRVAARVVADAPYAAAVEFGNVRVRGHHTMRRAL